MKESLNHKRKKKDYLTREERGALKSLRNRILTEEIVIKPADKGSATVVKSRDDYVAEAMRQLTREEQYHLLDRDPATKYAEEITKLLAEMKAQNTIDQETKDYLTPLHVIFYLLPKIHKPGNPGRPIVSSCGAPTEKISQIVDYHLCPLVETLPLPSFIKDTTSFITKLQSLNNIPEGTFLVTFDVSSLYTNIPHHEGIEACTEALNTIQQPPTEDVPSRTDYLNPDKEQL